ncbi:MAG: glycosyltransferase family 2 protein, partial [Pseudonocardiaceae bacterium]
MSAVAWSYLVAGNGGFWLATPRLSADPPEPSYWPSVGLVVPACDESAVLPETLPTLLGQEYPGELAVWLVDDGSSDGTGALARALAERSDGRASLTVLTAPSPAPGWTG